MRKLIKQIGTSIGIIFNKEEAYTNDLEVGMPVNVEIEKLKDLKRKVNQ